MYDVLQGKRKKTNAVKPKSQHQRTQALAVTGETRKIGRIAPLVERVATVNDAVGASHEAGGIRGKEDAKAVELVDIAKACLWGETRPDLLLGIEGGHLVQGGVHVARGD